MDNEIKSDIIAIREAIVEQIDKISGVKITFYFFCKELKSIEQAYLELQRRFINIDKKILEQDISKRVSSDEVVISTYRESLKDLLEHMDNKLSILNNRIEFRRLMIVSMVIPIIMFIFNIYYTNYKTANLEYLNAKRNIGYLLKDIEINKDVTIQLIKSKRTIMTPQFVVTKRFSVRGLNILPNLAINEDIYRGVTDLYTYFGDLNTILDFIENNPSASEHTKNKNKAVFFNELRGHKYNTLLNTIENKINHELNTSGMPLRRRIVSMIFKGLKN